MRGSSSFALRTRRLRFACASARPPKPRGIAGISRPRPRCARKVSATADSVAVGPVSRELVSSPKSLIFRENTGKLSRSWLPARLESQIRPVLEVLAGVFPAFGNREISANEHGSPPGRRTQGRERRSCQPPAFGNCWRYGSADFWHTTPDPQLGKSIRTRGRSTNCG